MTYKKINTEELNQDDFYVFYLEVTKENFKLVQQLVKEGVIYSKSVKLRSDIELVSKPAKIEELICSGLSFKLGPNVSESIRAIYPAQPSPSDGWLRYWRPKEIWERLNNLANTRNDICELIKLDQETHGFAIDSHEEDGTYPLGLRIGKVRNGSKPAILIVGGIHGDEFISHAALMGLIGKLITIKNEILQECNFFILPLLNPDGLSYSILNGIPWRKNTNSILSSRFASSSLGVDLNRNFPIYFGYRGASSDIESLTFSGSYPLSEPETIGLNRLIRKEKSIIMALDCHAGEEFKLYRPTIRDKLHTASAEWDYTRTVNEFDDTLYKVVEERLSDDLNQHHGEHQYQFMLPGEYSGTSDEYFYHAINILGFAIEFVKEKRPNPIESVSEQVNMLHTALISLAKSCIQLKLNKLLTRKK